MKKNFGVISKIIDPDLYTVEVDIPGENIELKAFPKRGEVDEPRVGDVVWLEEIDPLYHSYYLYEKLKENDFIGIRSRGKVLRFNSEEVSIGIFDPSNESWYDKNDGVDPTPKPTSWIKLDAGGNIDINAEGNENIVIAGTGTIKVSGDITVKAGANATVEVSGNASVKVSGNTAIESSGNCNIKASGSCTIDSPDVKVTGASMTVGGTAPPSGSGPFCAVPNCIFSGCVHVGNKSLNN